MFLIRQELQVSGTTRHIRAELKRLRRIIATSCARQLTPSPPSTFLRCLSGLFSLFINEPELFSLRYTICTFPLILSNSSQAMSNRHGTTNPFGKKNVQDNDMEVLFEEMGRKATSMRALMRGPIYSDTVAPGTALQERIASGKAKLLESFGARGVPEPGPSSGPVSDIEARISKSQRTLELITADDMKIDGDGVAAARHRIKDVLKTGVPSKEYRDLLAKRTLTMQPYPNRMNSHPSGSLNVGEIGPIRAKAVAVERYTQRLLPPSQSNPGRSDHTTVRHEDYHRSKERYTPSVGPYIREDHRTLSVDQSSSQMLSRTRTDPKSCSDARQPSPEAMAIDPVLPDPAIRAVPSLMAAKPKPKDVGMTVQAASASSRKGKARAITSPEPMEKDTLPSALVTRPVAAEPQDVVMRTESAGASSQWKLRASAGASSGKIKSRAEGVDRVFGGWGRSDEDIKHSEAKSDVHGELQNALKFATKLSKRWENEVFPERWVPMLSDGFKITTDAGKWIGIGGETHSLVNTDILRIRSPGKGVRAAELYLSDTLVDIGIQMVIKELSGINFSYAIHKKDSLFNCNLYDARHGRELHYDRVDKLISYLARGKPHSTRHLWNRHTILMPICGESHWYLIVVINPRAMITTRDPSSLDANVVDTDCIIVAMDSMAVNRNDTMAAVERYLRKRAELDDMEVFRSPRHVNLMVPAQPNAYDCGIFVIFFAGTVVMQSEWFRHEVANQMRVRTVKLGDAGHVGFAARWSREVEHDGDHEITSGDDSESSEVDVLPESGKLVPRKARRSVVPPLPACKDDFVDVDE
ncbi:hypothetical protein EUX98_g4728 [Antrodiella citrinella]|uniref:Ubiquitin-like protease family profile domain-containing protein n=1 Tax=Antrodiella citrinella TaxID=2447956 RepID=A0A4S4N182_9APHY|nr:hypothetical protein EUX98_g4728 [Antrodiella citrinella]